MLACFKGAEDPSFLGWDSIRQLQSWHCTLWGHGLMVVVAVGIKGRNIKVLLKLKTWMNGPFFNEFI